MNVEEIIKALNEYWEGVGCKICEEYDIPVGAATLTPDTFFSCFDHKVSPIAYKQKCERPSDGVGGKNPYKIKTFNQYQVLYRFYFSIARDLYIDSLVSLGMDLKENDIQFIADDWSSPAIGASGLGWEVCVNGVEISQFTYFQIMGSQRLKDTPVEIAYGLERLAMILQGKSSILDVQWDDNNTVADKLGYNTFRPREFCEKPVYSDSTFANLKEDVLPLVEDGKFTDAYDLVVKAAHHLNVLHSHALFLEPERKRLLKLIRNASSLIAKGYCASLPALVKGAISIVQYPYIQHPSIQYNEETSEDEKHEEYDEVTLLFEVGYENIAWTECGAVENFTHMHISRMCKENGFCYKSISTKCSTRRLTVQIFGMVYSEKDGAAFGMGMQNMLNRIPFTKRMTWDYSAESFCRPIKWIFFMFGNDLIPFKYAGISSEKKSSDYKIPADRSSNVSHFEEQAGLYYHTEKRDIISRGIVYLEDIYAGAIPVGCDYIPPLDPWIMDAVVDNTIKNSIYLASHKDGPCVAIFSENKISKKALSGYEEVIKSAIKDMSIRLSEDSKLGIRKMCEMSKPMVIHKVLGTVEDKSNRLLRAVDFLDYWVHPGVLHKLDIEALKKSIKYLNADYSSSVVRAYPELVGTVGSSLYKEMVGEDDSLVQLFMLSDKSEKSIRTSVDAVLAILHCVDTLIRFFRADCKPSGWSDQYGLKCVARHVVKALDLLKSYVSIEYIIKSLWQKDEEDEYHLSDEFVVSASIKSFIYKAIEKYVNAGSLYEPIYFAQRRVTGRFIDVHDLCLRAQYVTHCQSLNPPLAQQIPPLYKRIRGLIPGDVLYKRIPDYPCHAIERDLIDVISSLKLEFEYMYVSTHSGMPMPSPDRDSYTKLYGKAEVACSKVNSFLDKFKIDCEDSEVKNGRIAMLYVFTEIMLSIMNLDDCPPF